MNDIEEKLRYARPKPRRELATGFTLSVVDELKAHPRLQSSRLTLGEKITMRFHKPATVFASIAALVLLGGTAYATNGFTQLPTVIKAFFASEQKLENGDRIVTIATKDCKIESLNGDTQNENLYYRISSKSKLTNEQVTQMVQGNCEFADETAERLEQWQRGRVNSTQATTIGGYVNDKIVAITPKNLTLRTTMRIGASITVRTHTYNHFSDTLTIKDEAGVLQRSDLKIGDSVSITYSTTGAEAALSEAGGRQQNTDEMTIQTITRNSANIAAAFDYENYRDIEFWEVVPCKSDKSGYCMRSADSAADAPIPEITTANQSDKGATLVQEAYDSYLRASSSDNLLAAKQRALSAYATDELIAQVTNPSLGYDGFICAQNMPETIHISQQSTNEYAVTIGFDGNQKVKLVVKVSPDTNRLSTVTCPKPMGQ